MAIIFKRKKKKTEVEMTLERCGWATSDPLYLAYHDSEWGVPCFQSRELFAMLLGLTQIA